MFTYLNYFYKFKCLKVKVWKLIATIKLNGIDPEKKNESILNVNFMPCMK